MTQFVFLGGFSVMQPDPGLIFWTTVIFLLVWVVLGRTAFRPIQESLKKRDSDIQNALDEAKRAREEIGKMQSQNELLLKEAQEQRATIIKEAKEIREATIKRAEEEAKVKVQAMIAEAKTDVEHMRLELKTSIKNELGNMALDIAEKLVRKELKSNTENMELAQKLVEEIKFN
ncbi:F0F1 ATP synthase subunit B [Haliscomenobacter sp.]|uniref:F0F1 ATP synthase subunit B family protein n=1 Tax=Haliscomenobacter sp. TaxID=2717303 RepID=UPI003BAC2036